MRKLAFVLVSMLLIVLVTALPLSVSAESMTKSYIYDNSGKVKEITAPYKVDYIFDEPENRLLNPEDMHVFDNKVYVLDSGNNRIVVFNDKLKFENEIKFFKDGKVYETKELKGIFVNKDAIYVADRSGNKVFKTDFAGNVILEIFKPKTSMLTEDNIFSPMKVIVDSLGQIYILVENEYRGALMLNKDGNFLSFYGAGDVKVTAEVLMENFWRMFKTDAQLDYSKQTLSVVYKNFAIDGENFIYAVEDGTDSSEQPLRKMNSSGTDILSVSQVGDASLKSNNEKDLASSFVSVAVDDSGFITILDSTWQRLFQYNKDGELLYVFGGRGVQNGSFINPIDVAALGDRLIVLDKDSGQVTSFAPTQFGTNIRKANELFEEGLFDDSLKPWNEVMKIDGNFDMAYIGLGKISLMNRDYVKAMEYFKAADSKDNYSIAFKRYRSIYLRENLTKILIVIAAIIVLAVAFSAFKKKKKIVIIKDDGNLSYLKYCVFHPSEGFSELRYNNKYCYPASFALLVIYAFVQIIDFFYRGFIFNGNNAEHFNIFITAFVPLAIFVSFIILNWLMASFFEGKGKLNQVFTVVTYSLVPLIVTQLISIIASNVITSEEGVFLNYVTIIGYILFAFILILGLGGVHMLDFRYNVALLISTVIAMVLVVFIIFLMFNLFAEFGKFVETLVKEISFRSSVGF